MHADDAHALAEQHFATLVAALEAGRSDALLRYLETASRFHTYSFSNQCLIAAQCPTATRVAGYQAWRRLWALGPAWRNRHRHSRPDHASPHGRRRRR